MFWRLFLNDKEDTMFLLYRFFIFFHKKGTRLEEYSGTSNKRDTIKESLTTWFCMSVPRKITCSARSGTKNKFKE